MFKFFCFIFLSIPYFHVRLDSDSIDEIGTQPIITSENLSFRDIPVRDEMNSDFEKKKKKYLDNCFGVICDKHFQL